MRHTAEIGAAAATVVILLVACTPRGSGASDPIERNAPAAADGSSGEDPGGRISIGSADTPAPAARPAARTHIVVSGDTLWGLAVASGCTVEAIRRASGVESDIIYPGQALRIPDCTAPEGAAEDEEGVARDGPDVEVSGTYLVVAGDVLETIALDHGCSVSELMVANALRSDVIYAGSTLRIPHCVGAQVDVPVGTGEYRVRPGDVLFAIAREHGCAVGELVVANGLRGDLIRSGQILTIPADCTGDAPSRLSGATVDSDLLPRLMRERGFVPPDRFKAFVVEITFSADRTRVAAERRFAYGDTAWETNWNPASSIKLFAAVAAMRLARDRGFTRSAEIAFHGATEHTTTLGALLQAAIGPSDNIAYNRLVQFVGYDELNGRFLGAAGGFPDTAIRRPYARSQWMELGEASSFRETPAMTIGEGGRRLEVPELHGTAATACGGAACTTLADLAELMRRLMLQEQLSAADSFDLPMADLISLRRTMRTDRARGDEVVDALAQDFPEGSRFYHKAGFAGDWYSDNVYVFDPTRGQAWIVAMAGFPGRSSLTSAAGIVGAIIADGTLRRN